MTFHVVSLCLFLRIEYLLISHVCFLQVKMAVFSAIKNKKNRKLREGIEELANKFSVNKDEDSGVQYIDVSLISYTKHCLKNGFYGFPRGANP